MPSHNFLVFIILSLIWVRIDGAPAAFNVWCAPNQYQQPGSTNCEVCGINSFASTGNANLITGPAIGSMTCFDSFEATSIALNWFQYTPTWNSWTFFSNAGISGSAGPWIPPAANAASGLYFAYIQTPATNVAYAAMSRTISNLKVGTPATVSFATSFRNGYGPPPAGSSLVITYGSQAVGSYTTVPGAWSSVSYTFTPNTASATLLFTYTMAGTVGGWSISIDMVSVNQYCPVGSYTEQITGSCQTCSGNTFTSGCFDSFEGSAVAAGGFAYNPGPGYNGWNFGACSGIGGINSPWDSSPKGSGGGRFYAYIQGTCALSRTVTTAGTWAIVEFHYAFRAGTQNAYINPLALTWNGVNVWSTIDWQAGWKSAVAQFAVSSGTGSLVFSHTNLKVGDATILVDYVSINYYCSPGTYPNPTLSTCTACPAGSFLTSPMTPQGPVVTCSLCPAGTFTSVTGSSVCNTCPVGTFSTGTGNTACTACSIGTSSSSGASVCAANCPAGSYNDGLGSCISCPAGTFSSSTSAIAASTCVSCGAGLYSRPGATACTSTCPDGHYSSWGVPFVCFPCIGSAFSATVTVAGQGMSSGNKCVENFEASTSIGAPGGWAYLPGQLPFISLGTNTQSQIPWNNWVWNTGGISAQGTSPWDTSPSTIAPGGGSYYAYLQANPGDTIVLPSATLTRTLSNFGSSGYVVVSYAYTSRNQRAPSTGSALVSTIAGVTIAASNVFLTSWTRVGPIVVALPYGALQQNSAMLQFQLNQATGDCAVLIDVITVTGACAPSTYLATGTTNCLPCGLGTYATAGLSACLFCPVPSVLNSLYEIYPNSASNGWIYAFQCNKGFWDTPVNRTCATATGVISGSIMSCKSCIPPTVSSPIQSTGNYLGDPSVWSLTCEVGYTGIPTTRTCSTSTGTYSGVMPTCSPCSSLGGGYYCVGGVNNFGPIPSSPGAYPCPPGTFGLAGVNLGSNVCSGQCQSGYFCPLASTSSTAQPCGSAAVYCPLGSGAPLQVSANYYSTPLSSPPSLRTGQAPCPINQQCLNGVILAPVDFTQNCGQSTGGATKFGVNDGTTGATFGPQLTAATPGYAGVTTYSISNLQTADLTCSATTLLSGTGLSTTTISTMGQLSVSSLYTISSTACDDKATNPHYAFRRTYKALYMNYRPGSWFWEFIICIRKFLIAFCSLMFRATPSFQLAMALLVIFIAYVLQVRSLPYLSHAKAVEAYREHELKVLEGNSIHTKIDNEMKARAAYYARGMAGGKAASLTEVEKKKNQKAFATSGGVSESPLENFYASRRSAFENQLREGRATILRNKVASFIFDYNTAEAVLLASCLLINLAGICFDSSRFSANLINMPGRKAEYDSLAFAVISVIFISLIFWIISLSTDIALVLSPQAVNSCLGGLGKARKGLVAQAQKMVKSSSKQRMTTFSTSGSSKKDPNEIQFETNMVLLKSSVRSESEEDGTATLQDLQRIIQELRDQRNLDSISMQEMQSRLKELGEIGSVKKTSRSVTAKKAFVPVDSNKVENPLAESIKKSEEDSIQLSKKEMFKAKVKELATTSSSSAAVEKDSDEI